MATRVVDVRPEGMTRERNVLWSLLGLLVLVGGIALPAVQTLRNADEGTSASSFAIPSTLTIRSLEAFTPLSPSALPRSRHPVGGMAFVRCTNLWTARPDGTGERRLLNMAGLSSPTFSPDGRTIAFLAQGPRGQEIWMVGADGSGPRIVGTIAKGGTSPGTASALTWSPSGSQLAFALSPMGGSVEPSSIWTLHLASGHFQRLGLGYGPPFWLWDGVGAAVPTQRGGLDFRSLTGHDLAARLSSDGEDLTAGIAPGWWSWTWSRPAAILRSGSGGSVELALRRSFSSRHELVTTPPAGFRIDPSTRPAIAQGGPAAVKLIGPDGAPDLGLVDQQTGKWTVLDYAWDPVWSPAPPAFGPLPAQRATDLVRNLFSEWGQSPAKAALLLQGHVSARVAPVKDLGYAYGTPRRTAVGWSLPATVFGRHAGAFVFRRLRIGVHEMAGRLVADPVPVTRYRSIDTVDEAVAFLRSTLTANVLPPAGLPAGTRLARNPVSTYTWGGRTTGSLNLIAPGAGGSGGKMTIHYGDAGFGCVSPKPITVGATPGIATDTQVGWPAGKNETSAPYGISGTVPRRRMMHVARAMEAARLGG